MRNRQRAAQFRDSLQVIRLIEEPSTDPLGPVRTEVAANWETFATLRGNQLRSSTQTLSEPATGLAASTVRWQVRDGATPAAVTVNDQIIFGSRLFHITANEETGAGDRLRIITAVEILGATIPASP